MIVIAGWPVSLLHQHTAEGGSAAAGGAEEWLPGTGIDLCHSCLTSLDATTGNGQQKESAR